MTFKALYAKLVKDLLQRDIHIDDGFPESLLISFEIQNDLNLSHALREYYRLLGDLDAINQAHNRLLKFNDIFIEGNKLIFMEENQGVVYWGIDLNDFNHKDPPVYEGIPVEERHINEWSLNSSKCSDFLIAMFYWQAAMGGFPYAGIVEIEQSTLDIIEREWTLITEYQGAKIYGGLGQSICVYGSSNSLELLVGCHDENVFWEIGKKLAINLELL